MKSTTFRSKNTFTVNLKYIGLGTRTVVAKKVRTPKFSSRGGRTWDSVGDVAGGGEVYADTTWGLNGYIERNGKWYSFSLLDNNMNRERADNG